MFKKVLFVLMMCMLMTSLTGCQEKYTGNADNQSTSCGNIVMGNGKFAYDNDFIYFTDRENIYEYDMESGTTVSFPAKSDDVRSMYVQDKYVYFASNGLKRITKDGKKHSQVLERENGCLQLYVDGTDAFFLEGIEGSLFCRNLQDNTEQELISSVLAYYVDENSIYVVARENDIPQLFIADREEKVFIKAELSFEPIAVYVHEDALYLAERGSYQIVKVVEGLEERLPVYGTYYQVVNDTVVYLDSESYEDSCFELTLYDMLNGTKTIICEDVYDFNVLKEQYVCAQQLPQPFSSFYLYDLETGKSELLYSEGIEE